MKSYRIFKLFVDEFYNRYHFFQAIGKDVCIGTAHTKETRYLKETPIIQCFQFRYKYWKMSILSKNFRIYYDNLQRLYLINEWSHLRLESKEFVKCFLHN